MPGSRHRRLASEAKAVVAHGRNSTWGHATPPPLPRAAASQHHNRWWLHNSRGLELDHGVARLWPNRSRAFDAGRVHHAILSAGALPITNASERLRSGNLFADKDRRGDSASDVNDGAAPFIGGRWIRVYCVVGNETNNGFCASTSSRKLTTVTFRIGA